MTYRWNSTDNAAGYDAAAEAVHPYYREIQDGILARLPGGEGLLVDLGGGSGRLVERYLDRWPQGRAAVIDQSEAFLALAERRLARFGSRAVCQQARLQDAWETGLPSRPSAIVSMSAIHHLEPPEKHDLYRRCALVLAPGGVLLNGDEVRPALDSDYRKLLEDWAEHMRRGMAEGTIDARVHPALHSWIERNVTRFGEPKKSGDDCHETIDAQLEYFREAGFSAVDCPWQRQLWAVLEGRK